MRHAALPLVLASTLFATTGCEPGTVIDVIVKAGHGQRPGTMVPPGPDAGAADGGPAIPAGCHCTRRPDSRSYQPVKCVPGADDVASAVIGPEGGTLSLRGTQTAGVDVRLEIPPGALEVPTRISITELSAPPPEGIVDYSPLYRFDPPGLRFARPARLRLPWGNVDGPTVALLSIMWSVDGGRSFSSLPDNYVNAGFNQASIDELGLGISGAPAVNEPAHCR